MRKRILHAWRVLTGDMKAVPQGATVIYGCTFTDTQPYTVGTTATTATYRWPS